MKKFKNLSAFFLVCLLFIVAQTLSGFAQTKPNISKTDSQTRDGQHDFDWEIGNWNVKISRLQKPLTGSTTWAEFNGTVVCRKVWDGKGNLAEVVVNAPSGRLEFLALRLYNPQSRQWTNTFSGSGDGKMGVPMYGEFKNGRGEFYDQEDYNGIMIMVRFTFIPLTADSGRSEQAFSEDGGKTWETNWINIYTRAKDEFVKQPPIDAAAAQSSKTDQSSDTKDGQRDFDFQFGTWKTHVKRLRKPLTGSTDWVEYDGISVVRKVWDGRASLIELEVDGAAGHIQGLGLRLYNPETRQWSINWASSFDGVLQMPMSGEFKNGRGEFYDHEIFNGKFIFDRNSFFDITPTSIRFEQAFSDDGGKTWEANWLMTFTRVEDKTVKSK
jgi:BNR/Asp-box repeat